MNKNFYVFSDWVAKKMAEEGYTYILRPDLKDPKRVVYIFDNTREIRQAFSRIMHDTEALQATEV